MDTPHRLLELLPLLIYGLPVLMVIVCGFIGASLERRHFASIRERELALRHLPVFPSKFVDDDRPIAEATLVSASVVVSVDYFKRFLANLRNLFGGRLSSYETLLDRARREAVLRLKEQNPHADLVINLRLETSTITKSRGKQGVAAVEVLASATAIRYAPAAA